MFSKKLETQNLVKNIIIIKKISWKQIRIKFKKATNPNSLKKTTYPRLWKIAEQISIFNASPLAPKFKLRLETELSPTKSKTKKTPKIIEKV